MNKISLTNRQLRKMGWASFFLAAGMSVAGGFSGFDPSDTVILAFLGHAALSFGFPTVRNIYEQVFPNGKPGVQVNVGGDGGEGEEETEEELRAYVL